MLFQTEGLVLQTIKFGDTSVIAKVFTQKLGLQSYVIRGVGSKKSSFKMNYFQPLRLLEIVAYQKENNQLSAMKEVKPIAAQNGIYNDIYKTSICLFLAEVLQKVLKETEIDTELYTFLKNKVTQLDEMNPLNMNFHLYFLWELSSYLGFEPQNNYSLENTVFSFRDGCFIPQYSGTQDVSFYASGTKGAQLSQLLADRNIECNNYQRKELLEMGIRYFQIHSPSFTTVRSLEILKELFQ